MQLNELQPNTKKRDSKRIGRGGKRGKTSGRGHKGQKSRAGTGIRPAIRDQIKKLPKLRGHGQNRARTVNPDRIKAQSVNVAQLEVNFDAGATISPRELLAKGLVRKVNGKTPSVKILGKGEVKKAFKFERCTFSESAKKLIEGAGGSFA